MNNITLHEKIKSQIVEAMRAKDSLKLETLRSLTALFSNEMIAKNTNTPFIDDESAIAIIKKSAKQHKDSIEQFEKGGRTDLVEKEKAELEILETYLPQMMSVDEIRKVVESKLAGTSLEKPSSGQFMGQIMKELKGKADGADVKAVIDSMVK